LAGIELRVSAAHVVQMTNACSPSLPKISGNWSRSFLHRSVSAQPDEKGACALISTWLFAQANKAF
jgi:hypothetical protein